MLVCYARFHDLSLSIGRDLPVERDGSFDSSILGFHLKLCRGAVVRSALMS